MRRAVLGPGLRVVSVFLLALLAATVSGCTYVVSLAADELATNLGAAVRNQNDPETVRQGAPAYLLLVDSLVEGDGNNYRVLFAGARIYDSYSSIFVNDVDRARRLSGKAWSHVNKGLCLKRKAYCDLSTKSFAEYSGVISKVEDSDAAALYTYASVWAGWIQVNSGNWKIVADIPKVRVAMERVAQLHPDHDQGVIYLYLGGLASLLPPALGGKPEEARQFFEKAFDLSDKKNLMAQVMLAEKYARPTFNRKLHDSVLKQVVAANVEASGFTLTNVLAQERAQKLLRSANEYF
ncbi:MAG: TRAP transporter TatT component family protein [Gammaproteobacteria bacterium]|nr:TRAP transporter TatT component family protein [Gammaproteobacteria bacterium]